jgi:hypothetical protein
MKSILNGILFALVGAAVIADSNKAALVVMLDEGFAETNFFSLNGAICGAC